MSLSADERRSIDEELVKTKAVASGVVETIAVMNDVMAQIRDQSYETMAEIRSAADKMILEVRSREEKLTKKVIEILEWKEASLRQQTKALEDFLAELQQSIDYTSDILNKPDNQDIGEWKTALSAQLQSLQNMKSDYICKPLDIDEGTGFVFLYDNEQLLKSIANYGSVLDNVKPTFDYDRREGKGMSGIPVIPVITLNGLIVDLVEEEKKKYTDSDTDSSDDEDDDDDESDNEEESDTGASDDQDYDEDDVNDIPLLTRGHKTIRNTINDDNVYLQKNDAASDVSDGFPKNVEKNNSDKQKIEKAMIGPKTNKVQKLSTLL